MALFFHISYPSVNRHPPSCLPGTFFNGVIVRCTDEKSASQRRRRRRFVRGGVYLLISADNVFSRFIQCTCKTSQNSCDRHQTGDSSFRSSSDRRPTEKEQPAHGGDTGHGYLKATPYPHPPKKRNAHAFFWPPHYEKSFSVVGHKETWKHKRYSKESSRRLLSTAHSKRGQRPNASRTDKKRARNFVYRKKPPEPCQFDLSSLTMGEKILRHQR